MIMTLKGLMNKACIFIRDFKWDMFNFFGQNSFPILQLQPLRRKLDLTGCNGIVQGLWIKAQAVVPNWCSVNESELRFKSFAKLTGIVFLDLARSLAALNIAH